MDTQQLYERRRAWLDRPGICSIKARWVIEAYALMTPLEAKNFLYLAALDGEPGDIDSVVGRMSEGRLDDCLYLITSVFNLDAEPS